MKLKKLFSAIGLGLFAVASVSAGVLAFAKGPRMEEAKAEGETWMIHATFNAGEIASWEGVDLNSFVFRCGLNGEEGWQEASMHYSGKDNVYCANLSFGDSFSFNRVQVKFQQGSSTKWAVPYTANATKASHSNTYNLGYSSWVADTDTFNMSLQTDDLYFKYNNVQFNFVEDPTNNRFIAENVVISEPDTSKYYVLRYRNGWNFTKKTLTDRTINSYFSDKEFQLDDSWCVMTVAGTYDVILKNDYNDNGIIEFKLHSASREYIYLVGGDITEDTCIYTFGEGGVEEFGAFPGKPLKEVVDAEEIHGDLKFQGEENNIWRVELNMNYPAADHIILAQLNEHGVVGTQTADMLLMRKSAYWFSYDPDYHNTDAGYALDFLFLAEAYRKAATDGSVCDISLIGAQDIVSEYNSKGTYMQTTYIDNTLVNTWTDNTRTVKAYVSYKSVVQELAKKVEAAGTNQTISFGYQTNGNMIVVIIFVITTISVAGVVALVIIRKRKHQ